MSESSSDGPPLFGLPVDGRVWINARLVIEQRERVRTAWVDGALFHNWGVDDDVGEDLFVVQARVAEVATVDELAAACGHSRRTLFRAIERYATGGAAAVIPRRAGRPVGSGIDVVRDARIRQLHTCGLSGRAIARETKTSPVTVTRALARLGLESNTVRQARLPVPAAAMSDDADREPTTVPSEAASEVVVEPVTPDAEIGGTSATEETSVPASPMVEVPVAAVLSQTVPVAPRSHDVDPLNRVLDRLLAATGDLDDAAPFFAPGSDLPYLGLLLAVPHLVQTGLLQEATRLYPDFGPAFYGIRSTLLIATLLPLVRIKRAEHLKEFAPPELGRVFGLDRVPEVKTMRRKLRQLADGPSEDLMARVAIRRARSNAEALGWLYVDGHVRVYHGKHRLPATHVARMRIALPATQDMWVHDGNGSPVFVVTQEAHPSLAQALPPVLASARELIGGRRVTMVFDRGGWSPDLFRALVAADADFITYRKGGSEPLPDDTFMAYPARAGEEPWLLHDMSTRLANGLWVRQVTRRRGSHQTAIVTTRQDLAANEVAHRMFNRWRQENYFKYMRQEFDLDGLVEYGCEEEDPLRELPNPDRRREDQALKRAREAHARLLAHHRDFVHPDVVAAQALVDKLRVSRAATPARVRVEDLANPTVRLPARRKNLADRLKTIAWQIETDLVGAIAPHYRRVDEEGRTLIAAALRSRGRIELAPGELRVTLAPQSSPHRSRVVAHLCSLLNATATCFPGTALRLRYAIDEGHRGRPSSAT